MSKGQNIKIDEEDLQKIKANLSASLITVKQAIINPSFLISITPLNEEDFEMKPKIVLEEGVARMVGQEKINKLEDVFNSSLSTRQLLDK